MKITCTDLALIFLLICVNIINVRRRSRAVSIPTAQIKRTLQKSKKVIIKVQKHIRKVVPHSSKLHSYLSSKSSALYHRLNNKFFVVSDYKRRLKSAKKQKLNFNKSHYQSRYHCFTKIESLRLLFVQTRTPKHKSLLPMFIPKNMVRRNYSALVYKYSG